MPAKTQPSRASDNSRRNLVIAAITLVTAFVWLIYKILPPSGDPGPTPGPTPVHTPTPKPLPGGGRLEGALTDRSENPISGMRVGIRSGPQTQTDAQGNFVLNGAPTGDQMIIVESANANTGQLAQNIHIATGQTTKTKIIYDAQTSQLGLLAITAPVDSGELEVRRDGNEHRATMYGRCDGLPQILGGFDIWVLIKSERDQRLWVQHPPAIIDTSARSWRANVMLGDPQHPPRNGERWDIVAVAAVSNSDIRRIANTPSLSQLPPHISSNVVTTITKINR